MVAANLVSSSKTSVVDPGIFFSGSGLAVSCESGKLDFANIYEFLSHCLIIFCFYVQYNVRVFKEKTFFALAWVQTSGSRPSDRDPQHCKIFLSWFNNIFFILYGVVKNKT
jgi:hypothetical protein